MPKIKALFLKLFEKDPEKRMKMESLKDDPWLTKDGSEEIDLDLSELSTNNSALVFGSVGKVEVEELNREIC